MDGDAQLFRVADRFLICCTVNDGLDSEFMFCDCLCRRAGNGAVANSRSRRVLQRPRHVRAIGHDGFQLSRIWNPHIPGFQAGCRNAGRGEYRCAVGKTGELRFIGRVISTAFVSVLDRVLRSRRQVLKCNQITVTDDGFPLAPGSAYSAPIFLTACCVNRDTILCSPLHCAYTGWHLGPGRDLFTGCSRLACKGTLRRFYSEIQVHLTACPAHLG